MLASFASDVRRSFDALAQQFMMFCVLSNDWEVRYENDSAFLIINFDNGRSYELGIEIGRKTVTQPEQSFSLAEILRLRGVLEAASIDGMMISDIVRLPDALAHLALLVSLHAADFLMGNDFSFAQIAKLRQREMDTYALEGELRAARARSGTAWEKRDYQGVINALEPVQQHLSPAEKKRLSYARSHLAQ